MANKTVILNQHEQYALCCVEVGRVSGRQDNNQSRLYLKKKTEIAALSK